MYELSEKDKESGGDKKLEKSADWDGPVKDRSCTDCLFIVGLIVAWLFMTYIGIMGSTDGHVGAIIHGYKPLEQGNAKEYACDKYYYPINFYLSSAGNYGVVGACVDECPTSTYDGTTNTNGYCIDGDWPTGNTPTALASQQTKINEGKCFPAVESTPFVNRCLFTADSVTVGGTEIDIAAMSEHLTGDLGYMSSFFTDIHTARNWVFGFGFCVALVLSFLWCYILKLQYVVDLFIWTCFLSISGFAVILGALMMNTANDWKDKAQYSKYQVGGLETFSIICLVLAFLWLCLLCAVRKQISLAIGLVKCTAVAILDMPGVIGYPVFQLVGFVLFLIPWIIYCIMTAAMGTFKPVSGTVTPQIYLTTPTAYPSDYIYTFEYGSTSQWYPWILLFIFFWTVQFISAMGQITLGIIFSTWYFTRDRSTLDSGEVTKAIKASFKHSGTAAFGALIIAIIQMIRATIAYFQKKAKDSGRIGKVFQYILCLVQCCVCCLECCMKFINKNAYIQTAIFGTSFCASAKAAFFLIARNIIRIGAVSMVSELVILVGKLFIALFSAGLSYYCMAYIEYVKETISSPVGPAILVFIIAWFTADMFTDIFSMAISVLLQCFVADEEMFEDKSERFAPPELSEYIDANPMQFEEETKKELESNQANAL